MYMVEFTANQTQFWVLSEEGVKYVAQGTPEYQVLQKHNTCMNEWLMIFFFPLFSNCFWDSLILHSMHFSACFCWLIPCTLSIHSSVRSSLQVLRAYSEGANFDALRAAASAALGSAELAQLGLAQAMKRKLLTKVWLELFCHKSDLLDCSLDVWLFVVFRIFNGNLMKHHPCLQFFIA